MNVYEMEGFLRGKCLPGDLLVGESSAAYLVRKLNDATAVKAERDALTDKCDRLECNLGNALIGEQEVIRRADALAVENAAMREAIAFATAPDMWIEQHDGMLDYRYSEWYVDVLNAAIETPATDAALAAIEARVWAEAKDLAKSMLATDSADHIDFLFDGKIKQLQEAK
ncbi:TPA: hypothetical protein SMI27_000835 [Serratia liquefaciens]|nr:hypothetical protein [Serratia liquefaciens]